MIKLASLVGKDFTVPNRKKEVKFHFFMCIHFLNIYFFGELLQINLENTYECNKIALMKDANFWGCLIRLLSYNKAHAGEEPPIVILIFDFSDHVSEGGKMCCTLESYSKTKLPNLILIQCLSYGASNVQKADEILCATNPWAFCFMAAII